MKVECLFSSRNMGGQCADLVLFQSHPHLYCIFLFFAQVRKGLSNQSKYIETYIEKEKTPSTRTSQNWIAIIVDDGLFVPIACPIAPYKDGRSCIFRGTILAGNNVCLCVQRESMERIHGENPWIVLESRESPWSCVRSCVRSSQSCASVMETTPNVNL